MMKFYKSNNSAKSQSSEYTSSYKISSIFQCSLFFIGIAFVKIMATETLNENDGMAIGNHFGSQVDAIQFKMFGGSCGRSICAGYQNELSEEKRRSKGNNKKKKTIMSQIKTDVATNNDVTEGSVVNYMEFFGRTLESAFDLYGMLVESSGHDREREVLRAWGKFVQRENSSESNNIAISQWYNIKREEFLMADHHNHVVMKATRMYLKEKGHQADKLLSSLDGIFKIFASIRNEGSEAELTYMELVQLLDSNPKYQIEVESETYEVHDVYIKNNEKRKTGWVKKCKSIQVEMLKDLLSDPTKSYYSAERNYPIVLEHYFDAKLENNFVEKIASSEDNLA